MFYDVFQALHYEKRIKKWSAAKKRALASGDEQLLKMLASCQNDSSSAFVSTEYVPKRMRKR
jgi:putative endonuclease